MRQKTIFYLFVPTTFASLALAFSSFNQSNSDAIITKTSNQTQEIQQMSEDKKIVVADFVSVAKKAIPAVVSIKVQSSKKTSSLFYGEQFQDPFEFFGNNELWGFFGRPKQEKQSKPAVGQASGVIVSQDGYILTNSHVVHDMDNIFVQLTDGREFPAKVLGDDPNSDLALIKIDEQDLPYLTLGDSDKIQVGEWVAAVGNPFGLQGTLTTGVISAKSRNNLDIARYEDFIQTDAAINRGNSGGPLLNLDGEIIGINTAIVTDKSGYIGIGFAVPSKIAAHNMNEFRIEGKVSHGFLGVTLQSIDYNLAQAFGLKKVEGALVSNVSKDSPAEKGGLKVEDILLKFNGYPIENSASLRNSVYMMKPGTEVKLTVLRNNETIELPITVGNYSESSSVAAVEKNTQLGIEVGTLTPEIAKTYGYSQDQGVVITQISPSSVAQWAGLKKGSLITAVNRQKVSSIDEFNRAIAASEKGRPILLQVKQGDQYIFVSLQG